MIDAANLESAAKGLGWHIDYRKLKALFTDKNPLRHIRFYCVRYSKENQDNFFSFLKNEGYKLVTKPLKIIKEPNNESGYIRKANFDVEISVDALAFCDDYQTLVLFSGDSDFDYLVRHLKKKAANIIVISTQKHISRELIKSSDKYIDLKWLQRKIERK